MEYNTDGTYKSYGFRDGSPFNPMPYKMAGRASNRAAYGEGQEAATLLGELYGLGMDRANNWLDTGNEEVGWVIDSPYCFYGNYYEDYGHDDVEVSVRVEAELRSLRAGTASLFDTYTEEGV